MDGKPLMRNESKPWQHLAWPMMVLALLTVWLSKGASDEAQASATPNPVARDPSARPAPALQQALDIAELQAAEPPSAQIKAVRMAPAALRNQDWLNASPEQWPLEPLEDARARCTAMQQRWGQLPLEETPQLQESAQNAHLRLSSLMKAHADEFTRALGRWLAGELEDPQALAASATQGRTAWLAWAACTRGWQWFKAAEPLPACAAATAQRWAEMEPQNAAAWLNLASLAARQGDEAGQEASMQRAAQASEADLHQHSVTGAVAEVASVLELDWGVWLTLLNIVNDEPLTLWDMSALKSYCDPQAAAAGARQGTCQKLAILLMEQSRGHHELNMGFELAGLLGLPAQQYAGLREAVALGAKLELKQTERFSTSERLCRSGAVLIRNHTLAAKEGRVRVLLDLARRQPVAQLAAP